MSSSKKVANFNEGSKIDGHRYDHGVRVLRHTAASRRDQNSDDRGYSEEAGIFQAFRQHSQKHPQNLRVHRILERSLNVNSRSLRSMVRNTLSMGLFYGSLGYLAPMFNGLKGGNLVLDKLLDVSLGSTAKFVSIFVTNPLSIMKTRAESMKFIGNHTLWQDVKTTYRVNGITGFYHGFWATFMRDVPYQGIQFGIYKLLGELTNSFQKGIISNENGVEKIGI